MKAHSPPPCLTSWVMESETPLQCATKELEYVQQHLNKLSCIFDQLENTTVDSDVPQTDGLSPSLKRDKKIFGLRKKKYTNYSMSWGGNKGSAGDLSSNASISNSSPCRNSTSTAQDIESSSPISVCSLSVGLSQYPAGNSLSSSNPSLNSNQQHRPASLSAPISTTDSHSEIFRTNSELKIYSDFISLAKDIHHKLRSIINTLSNERDRLKTVLESDSSNNGPQAVIANLQNSLIQAVQQNNELRSRLNNIHASSDISEITVPAMNTSLSYNSLYVSTTDIFFDAEDFLNSSKANEETVAGLPERRNVAGSDTSSEAGSISSEEGSVSSENSDGGVSDYNPRPHVTEDVVVVKNMTGHRDKLPCPRPNTEGLSLWSLLRKNIGIDLSRVSMPVALNEPLSMLQRLCEELEYTELLDKAAETEDPYERMVYVAAFAVSSYGSSYYRAGSKPFNPLLGETYECVREDKGFRFVAEQVSHHPPVSVCHAESKNFIIWQDLRIKTKFWGKSMEFQPLGHVNLKILRPDCHDNYRWNKVTTCVHNLFSGQRWADLSGEVKIEDLDKNIICKLTFVKPNYWSAKRNEVIGTITDEKGNVVRKLFGKWNEALYCGVPPSAKCIWRPGTMPENHEMYYGFTRFAIELNELDPEAAKYLPKTDTRFRPDQRLLEEGDLTSAENIKSELEQKQRERRKQMEEANVHYEPKWFKSKTDPNGEEIWEFTGKYWECKKNPGFANMSLEQLW
ncbi:hypothetical protein V9T40_014591 [Parthenolecanium corni]|uniref:Oxysterol-binding protein n=1 Tax=Parthenolecanium corni TaxID=536013 RepID=A0AAN9T7D6_9HEMI